MRKMAVGKMDLDVQKREERTEGKGGGGPSKLMVAN